MTAAPLVTVGAAGFGRELLDVVDAVNKASAETVWELTGVLDDAPSDSDLDNIDRRGLPFLGPVEPWVASHSSTHFAVGVGSPSVRRRLARLFEHHGHRPATVCHPTATFGFDAVCAPGTVICAGVQISTNVHLGPHTHVNPNATIGHDSVLGAYVSVNPGAVISGACDLEEACLIGAGAVVLQGLRIGAEAIVGAAACVTGPVDPGSVVKVVPAR